MFPLHSTLYTLSSPSNKQAEMESNQTVTNGSGDLREQEASKIGRDFTHKIQFIWVPRRRSEERGTRACRLRRRFSVFFFFFYRRWVVWFSDKKGCLTILELLLITYLAVPTVTVFSVDFGMENQNRLIKRKDKTVIRIRTYMFICVCVFVYMYVYIYKGKFVQRKFLFFCSVALCFRNSFVQ